MDFYKNPCIINKCVCAYSPDRDCRGGGCLISGRGENLIGGGVMINWGGWNISEKVLAKTCMKLKESGEFFEI